MKVPAIKKLVENSTMNQLIAAEEAIVNEEKPQIEIEGEDEGEQLTHVLAAVFILNEMEKGVEFKTALREYTKMVRESIS